MPDQQETPKFTKIHGRDKMTQQFPQDIQAKGHHSHFLKYCCWYKVQDRTRIPQLLNTYKIKRDINIRFLSVQGRFQ